MVLSVRRGSTIAAALAAAGLASTLAACASSNSASPAANGAGSSTVQSVPILPAHSPDRLADRFSAGQPGRPDEPGPGSEWFSGGPGDRAAVEREVRTDRPGVPVP